MTKAALAATLLALGLAACGQPAPKAAAPALPAIETASITAITETDPVGTADDAADDPAIWRNAANPAASLIVATDKRAGLHVYDLAGKRLSFTPSPRLNNVDLRADVPIGGAPGILVIASDRHDIANAMMAMFRLDPASKALVSLGTLPAGPGEAYGMCLWQRAADKAVFAFVVLKDGRIDQFAIDASATAPKAVKVRSLKLATQSEGCVVDDRTGLLYVAEEDAGLWRFDAAPEAPGTATAIAKVDKRILFDDAEGLAIAPQGADGGWLIASSQGDNAYVLYRLPDMAFAGRFRIMPGPVDGTSETDGIDFISGDFGPAYPGGLFVAQDGDNAPETQNFKLASWAAIKAALKLGE